MVDGGDRRPRGKANDFRRTQTTAVKDSRLHGSNNRAISTTRLWGGLTAAREHGAVAMTTEEGSIHGQEGFSHFLTVYGFFSGFFIIFEIGWLTQAATVRNEIPRPFPVVYYMALRTSVHFPNPKSTSGNSRENDKCCSKGSWL